VTEENKGGFIAIKPSIEKAQYLENVCKFIKLENHLPANEMHVTIFYDKREPVISLYEPKIATYKAFIKAPALYNDALVLELESPELVERFIELKMMGFKSDYIDFKPHLTLKYGATKDDLEYLKDKFILFGLINSIDLSFEYSEKIQKL
jgi:hypothetical protein